MRDTEEHKEGIQGQTKAQETELQEQTDAGSIRTCEQVETRTGDDANEDELKFLHFVVHK